MVELVIHVAVVSHGGPLPPSIRIYDGTHDAATMFTALVLPINDLESHSRIYTSTTGDGLFVTFLSASGLNIETTYVSVDSPGGRRHWTIDFIVYDNLIVLIYIYIGPNPANYPFCINNPVIDALTVGADIEVTDLETTCHNWLIDSTGVVRYIYLPLKKNIHAQSFFNVNILKNIPGRCSNNTRGI